MNINEFFKDYKNHPVLFIGSGFSYRYLKNTYTWDSLLSKIAKELYKNEERYLDIKSHCIKEDNSFSYDKVATKIERDFEEIVEKDRNGDFKKINDIFYENMKNNIKLSRFKIYIAELFKNIDLKGEYKEEIAELKKIRKNIGSVITTNYDCFVEKIFDFKPLIGNDILLSNPYGSIYKIHGCVNDVAKIMITSEDYLYFEKRYELIRAQLLSLFIHNPIIFIGYGINDENIKKVLKTIFSYVPSNTNLAKRIRKNFLLVEYEKKSKNIEVVEHDIDMGSLGTIRINKIKTDDFKSIYVALSNLTLPISAMDVRKVQNIVKKIYDGGSIKVHITENIDDLNNDDMILAIGSQKTIQYKYLSLKEIMKNYFKIIEESNAPLLNLIDKQKVSQKQYFPIYGFSKINSELSKIEILKVQQKRMIENCINNINDNLKKEYNSIKIIIDSDEIPQTNKSKAIIWAIYKKQILFSEIEDFLKKYEDKGCTEYRRMLCVFDYVKYSD